MRERHGVNPPHQRPWVLLESDDPDREVFGDEHATRFSTLVEAIGAYRRSTASTPTASTPR